VELETAFAPDLGNVMADAGQMEQVIMNLILNARDAMPTGGRIRIETQNWELDAESAREHCMAAGPCIKLTISDTGVGISLEAVGQVFEPFFTTKDEGKGTGLGLSTVRSIVRQSGGDVWVESASGQGALFTICLPRIPSVVHEPVVRSAPTRSLSGTETVLLVEDEDGVRRLLTHVLHRRGYKVLAASSGMEALALFEEHRDEIALVLTDMVMAQMSGRQLAERLREIDSSTKVIFMSGYTDDVLVRTGALSPGMSFLQKPLRPDVLAEKVREALDSPTLPFNPR
jgi:CheY-like chemotaxis protein